MSTALHLCPPMCIYTIAFLPRLVAVRILLGVPVLGVVAGVGRGPLRAI